MSASRPPLCFYILLALFAFEVLPSTAHAYQFTNCFRAAVHTNDSGSTSWSGATEDHWEDCNTVGDCEAILRRARVVVDRPGNESDLTLYTNGETGCVTWSSQYNYPQHDFDITVETVSSNIRGRTDILVHDDVNYFGSSPSTYTETFTNPGVRNLIAGNSGGTWTTFAALGFSAYRWGVLPHGIKVYAAMDTTSDCYSSAHWGISNFAISSGRHYIRIAHNSGGCSGNSNKSNSKSKNVVAHEAGHAFAALYYGDVVPLGYPLILRIGEPNVDVGNSSLPNSSVCGFGAPTYGAGTKEYNSVGFREGFAHFVAAKVWNDKNANGVFGLFGSGIDLEWYSSAANWGGRLENVCCTTGCSASWDSAGTNVDWMRFFWDFYTNTSNSCSSSPSQTDMLNLYAQTRLNGGLKRDNYYFKMQNAVDDIGLPSCLSGSRFNTYGAVNGIDNE